MAYLKKMTMVAEYSDGTTMTDVAEYNEAGARILPSEPVVIEPSIPVEEPVVAPERVETPVVQSQPGPVWGQKVATSELVVEEAVAPTPAPPRRKK